MNKVVQRIRHLRTPVRSFSTAADIFEGIIKSKVIPESGRLPAPTYGGRHIVTMLPGIGAGPQMMEYVKEIFKAAYVPVDFEVIDDEDVADNAMTSIRRNGVGIKGHIPCLADTSSNVTLRSHLDLYIYLVHCKSYPNIRARFPDLDIYVFRQNTEGEYAMLEHESKPGIVESLKIVTKENTLRFARWAFEFARREGRKKVTVVHKGNIMKLSDGLFLKTVLDVAKDYPELTVNDMIIDNCCMQIVSRPKTFDVIITPNLYGNIVTNTICGLIGGPGLISGQNYGDYNAVFEVASRHITYEDKEFVNPIAMLNASKNLLYHLKKDDHAELIRKAIYKTLVEDKIHTPDIGGTNSGAEMVESIKKNIKLGMKESKIASF
ncbi:isocitrate dehydrogenase [NAD] subunit gamma, mitochondrial [Leptinotarsa decemlineata]|uniref:isocitrate dehydrogenase [NAD] subunit gamma, mitochondrial n=1 Tax=Leptinotarsa decemlineata TaxID=7539 RepID=UPI000C25459E|nr:isocitrate dehydrogenase [NAD] subunit gamma, mitochondrial-like [Leptinotarsa decemlineata]